jgi:hypothetical protein
METKKNVLFRFALLMALAFFARDDVSFAQSNPCAPKANPCAAKNPCAVNPCAAKNPCAANPCAAGGKGGGAAVGKAITTRGEVARVDPAGKKLVLKRESGQLDLAVSQHSVIRDGAKVKSLKDLKPGEKVTVSYIDTGKERTAWYVYSASAAAMANPCGGNPCAAKNPCSANPCAVKTKSGAKNPCAANPCAAKNPCAPKATKGR